MHTSIYQYFVTYRQIEYNALGQCLRHAALIDQLSVTIGSFGSKQLNGPIKNTRNIFRRRSYCFKIYEY